MRPNLLTRDYVPGTYYLAWSNYNTSNDQPSPPDDNYRGEVYVQLAPTAPPAITVAVTLTWGAVRWRGTIPVQPGALADRQGGTLLRFIKKDNLRSNPADWNPAVNLDSSVPVCAVFGTADTRPLPAPITVVETPGWTPN